MSEETPTPSEEFLEALHTRTSAVIDCEFCDRTYFVEEDNDWEEGELEGLRKRSEKEHRCIELWEGVYWDTLTVNKQLSVAHVMELNQDTKPRSGTTDI